MNLTLVEKIANAVLYEGYILYPYRASSVKNQQRWNFGALAPRRFALAQSGADAWTMQTECLVRGSERAALDVKIRFLHLLAREVYEPTTPTPEQRDGNAPDFRQVNALDVGGQIYQTWQEAIEREIDLSNINLNELAGKPRRQTFSFPASQQTESLRDANDQVVGVIIRKQQLIEGEVEASAKRLDDELFKISVHISNSTNFEDEKLQNRDEALMRSLVSTHTILAVRDAEFVSLLDPPEALREVAEQCQNIGTYPVLVGEEGERDCILSSPIILYDYPQIAPESAGDLFDGTEIDEILTLRIMTLTDEEKREMRGGDEHARRILERTEMLPAEQLLKLHGAMKGVGKAVKDGV